MKLPYKARNAAWAPRGVIYRPIVDLEMDSPTDRLSWPALVDTGLDVTLAPGWVASYLGLALSQPEPIQGLSGLAITVRFGDVGLELSDGLARSRWSARIAFYPGQEDCCLGHDGFFDLFHASFDNHRRCLTVRPHPGAPVLVT